MHYNYFRTYDPSTGRYLESDPIGLKGGLNTYSYVKNMPTMQVDIFGLFGTAGHAVGRLEDHRRNGGKVADAALNIDGSVGAFGHGAVVGLGANAGVSLKDGKACVFVDLCGSWGLGVFGTVGGQVGGGLDFGNGQARTGISTHTGIFYGGGAGGAAMYTVMGDEDSVDGSVTAGGSVRGGYGGGGAAGFISCKRLMWCPSPAGKQCRVGQK